MEPVGRLPLEGGGEIVFEALPPDPGEPDGPVPAGRVSDAVQKLPETLQQALVPVQDMAGAVVDRLREAGPSEVEVEFGMNLSAQAGAVISKGEAAAHLKVRVLWQATADGGTAGQE